MAGSIRQRGKESWEVRIYRGTGADGKKQYDHFTVKGARKDADRFLRERLHELDKGAYVGPNKMTFADHAEQWLTAYVRMHLRATTADSYEVLIRKHAIPAIGAAPLAKLAPPDLQKLYAKKMAEGLSARRVQYLHAVIHGCLDAAIKWGFIGRNVADAVDAPRPERREAPTLTPEQVDTLLKASEGKLLDPILLLAVGTGLRRGEILALKWEDIDFSAGVLRVRRSLVPTKAGLRYQEPKTAKGRRSVTLPPFVLAGLKRHKARQAEWRLTLGSNYQDTGLVCCRPDGIPLSPSTVTHAFSTLAAKLSLGHLRFHDLRHTHASLLLAQGVHPKVVQERLGHSTISITLDTYSHVVPTLQQEAAQKMEDVMKVRSRRPS